MIYRHRTGRVQDKTKLDAMIYNMIYSRIRRLWSIMSPDREHVMWAARREDRSGNRLKVFYKCAECSEEFPEKEIQVDHIEAIGARPETLDGLSEWIRRVFCIYTNLQVLCKPCHRVKSKEDMKRIREAKKNVQAARRDKPTAKKDSAGRSGVARKRTKAK